MPFVIHPTTYCDVCLEAYTNSAPYAIPCGHIFCENCLRNVEPSNCPLCRRPFAEDRKKRLYVELPEPDVARDWMDRVLVSFEADSDEKARLSIELETWLGGQAEDNHVPLRKAWSAFNAYTRLLQRKRQDRETIKSRETELRLKDDETVRAHEAFQADKSALLARVSELSEQVSQLKAQMDPLRSELARYQHTNNPLPRPPEPLDLSRFPSFARPAAESADGFAAYLASNRGSMFPSTSSKRKEKSRQQDSPRSPPSPFSPGQLNIGRNSNVIIPGATPSQRVIPSPDIIPGHAYITHIPASAYVNGYSTGYDEGYNAANMNGTTAPNYASTSAHKLPSRRPAAFEQDDSLEEAIGSLQLSGVPAASAAIASAYRPFDSRRYPTHVYPSHGSERSTASSLSSRPSSVRRSTVQVDGQLRSTQPPPIYAAPIVPTDNRFRTPPPNDPHPVRRETHQQHRPNRQSYSSWGTVHSNAPNSPEGTQGSLGVLGDLLNFPNAGARGNYVTEEWPILDRGLVSTPRMDDELPLGFTRPTAEPRAAHGHSYSVPGPALAMVPETYTHSSHENNRSRAIPRPFSQRLAAELGMASPMENALGLELGLDPYHTTINAPTPRVQLAPYFNSWNLNAASR
ncbi:hypothetical protein C8F01DRAFT_1109541 [Mycena amicta]|nr:hypothetical protein C8F01DRAFT_1109541 [Mycena amicta]